MKTCKTIYLIGPGRDKLNFELNFGINVLKNQTTLSFSSDLMWFHDNNIYPTFWTFLDPNSVVNILNKKETNTYNDEWFKGLKTHSTLIYNDFQGTDEFYHKGFTTSRGSSWNKNTFGSKILPTMGSHFKNVIKLPSIILNNNYSLFYKDNTTNESPVISQGPNINTDKFSCYVLPLVISYFTNLTEINCLGFGDFGFPRLCTGTSLGYEGYKVSYQKIKNELISLLKYKNINVKFYNKDSYFKELEWKK